MKKETIEALDAVASGLLELLNALSSEKNLVIQYDLLKLDKDCRDLRNALGEENIS